MDHESANWAFCSLVDFFWVRQRLGGGRGIDQVEAASVAVRLPMMLMLMLPLMLMLMLPLMLMLIHSTVEIGFDSYKI